MEERADLSEKGIYLVPDYGTISHEVSRYKSDWNESQKTGLTKNM